VFEEELDGFLGEGHGAADVGGQGVHECFMSLFEEGFDVCVFDTVDCDFELQTLEGVVGSDVFERS